MTAAAARVDTKTEFRATFEVPRLVTAMSRVRGAIERRNTIPILSNVRLDADGPELRVTATDLDLQIDDTVACQMDSAGATTIQGDVLADLLNSLPPGGEGRLSFDGADARVKLECGRSRYRLPPLPVLDFPLMDTRGLPAPVSFDTDTFKRLIDKTAFAISTEATRYYLNGLYLHSVMVDGQHRFRAVSTDGHRLALAECDAPEGFAAIPGVIIPRKAVAQISRLLDAAGETIKAQLAPAKVRFQFGTATLISKIIDGDFPDYVRVIPTENGHFIRFEKAVLVSALKRIQLITNAKAKTVKLEIEDGACKLTVRNMESGEGNEEISVDFDGPFLGMGFNIRYLLDVLDKIDGTTVELQVGDPNGPTIWIAPDQTDVKFVIMPVRV